MERVQFSGVDSNLYMLKAGFPRTDISPYNAECDIGQWQTNALADLKTEYDRDPQAT